MLPLWRSARRSPRLQARRWGWSDQITAHSDVGYLDSTSTSPHELGCQGVISQNGFPHEPGPFGGEPSSSRHNRGDAH